MPTNLLKKYPELLEILHLDDHGRNKSLRAVFDRDIQDNPNLRFKNKTVFPIKTDGEIDMHRQFKHLTCDEIKLIDEHGKEYTQRIFEKDRSHRLHWIKPHIDEDVTKDVVVFSTLERDMKKRKDVNITYLYNKKQKYLIVLEPMRECEGYFMKTAYYLNKEWGEKEINKKFKKKLPEIL